MSITIVQSGETSTSNAGVASGSSASLLGSNITNGDQVVYYLVNLDGDVGVATLSGNGVTTWTRQAAYAYNLGNEIYTGVSNGGTAPLTVTNTDGAAWKGWGCELSGQGIGFVGFNTGGQFTSPSTNPPSLPMGIVGAGSFVMACTSNSQQAITANPSTGGTWTTVNAGDITNAGKTGVSYQIIGSTAALTPTWAIAASHSWDAVGLVTTVGTGSTPAGNFFQLFPAASGKPITAFQPPQILSITPSSGPPAGGTSITLSGAYLAGVSSVTFGATPATSYTYSSPTLLTIVAPSGTGTVNVVVKTPAGTSLATSSDQFTYASTPLTITTAFLAGATQGEAYSYPLMATGGTPSYTWSITSGILPAGLSLAGSTGVISGTPSVSAVSETFTVQVQDQAKTTATVSLTIGVNSASAKPFVGYWIHGNMEDVTGITATVVDDFNTAADDWHFYTYAESILYVNNGYRFLLFTGNATSAEATADAEYLVANGMDGTIIRIMPEGGSLGANDGGNTWNEVGMTPTQFWTEFGIVAAAYRAVSPNFKIMYCPQLNFVTTPQNQGNGWTNLMTGFPGLYNAETNPNGVDYGGWDGYDSFVSIASWQTQAQQCIAFYNSQGVPWIIAEWGIWSTDDPAFINMVAALCTTENGCAGQVYFAVAADAGGGPCTDLRNGLAPNSLAAYIAAFG